ncbi:MAG TPA: AtpZ/AtpI family protein [Acidimicrobiales bacterium]|nr:AtpZ/AtpI family protein [Acidimicrobiales bacterium]
MDPSRVDIGERRELYGGFGNSLVMAFEFAATPFLFGLIGHFVDGRLGTGPWLTMFLVVFAIAGLTVRMYYGYVAAMEEHEAAAPWRRVSPHKQPLSAGADPALPVGGGTTELADQALLGRRQ